MTEPTALTALLEPDGVLRRAYMDPEPLHLARAVDPEVLPGVGFVFDTIDCSLLRRPYFAVVQDGMSPARDAIISTRRVGTQHVDGLIDGAKVRQRLSEGATLKLNQLEHWHPPVRALVEELGTVFPSAIKAFLFYTPRGKQGLLPHRDGGRAIILQIAGAKRWHLYDSPPDSRALIGGCEATEQEQTLVLEAGDLLFLPHGYAHAAEAHGDDSLHMTLTISDPSPGALATAFVERWVRERGTQIAGLDQLDAGPDEKAVAMLADLRTFADALDFRELVAPAVPIELARTPS